MGIETVISPGRKVRVFRNCVELWQDEQKLVTYTIEEWAALVEAVGIRGFAKEPMG